VGVGDGVGIGVGDGVGDGVGTGDGEGDGVTGTQGSVPRVVTLMEPFCTVPMV
jgi:hypothetical protein